MYSKYQFFLFHLHLWEKKETPLVRVEWDGGMYSKGGLRICVGNGATWEWLSLQGREDGNRTAIHDLATLDDRLRVYTMYN